MHVYRWLAQQLPHADASLLVLWAMSQGTISLVDGAKLAGGVTKFVLVSSLLTNAAAVGQVRQAGVSYFP